METASFQLKVMKMGPVSGIAVILLCCCVSKGSSSDCDLYAATGANVVVPLKHALQPKEMLKWKHKDELLFHRKAQKIVHGIKVNVTQNGSLQLPNVRKNEAGLYTSEVYNENGRNTFEKKTRLCVLDPVTKPTLKFDCKESNVIFTCNYSKQSPDLRLEWLRDNKVEKQWNKSPLNVKADDSKGGKFSCRISNKASQQSSNTLTHECSMSVIPGLPETLLGISIWIFVGGGGGIVLLLIIIVIICCIRTKKRNSMRLKDEEELRLDWTNNQQQNHHHHLPPLPNQHPNRHHHHHQHQQQQAGHTGPRQSRSKQQHTQRPKVPESTGGQPNPQPQPRRTTQVPRPADGNDEHPPPLPQPRKKAP
ncbi:T-cell surface antigen CD2 [Nothobranchius furzeri]|uniref:CD2 molecule n=1 Tax=Nothobranchius furzeri TaxID=105023 RepID=A0A9D2Y8I8_NOTFU|nr:T-cell surface antigen CD2 [Nothobranchius furzeri]KAF7214744.1 CD2 molecule [Nothobranchius furzeri]